MSGVFGHIHATMAAPGYSPPDRRVLWEMSGGRCFWCDTPMFPGGSPVHPRFFTVDHLHSRREAGMNRKLKIAACRQCNVDRGGKSAELYWRIWAERLRCQEAKRA